MAIIVGFGWILPVVLMVAVLKAMPRFGAPWWLTVVTAVTASVVLTFAYFVLIWPLTFGSS